MNGEQKLVKRLKYKFLEVLQNTRCRITLHLRMLWKCTCWDCLWHGQVHYQVTTRELQAKSLHYHQTNYKLYVDASMTNCRVAKTDRESLKSIVKNDGKHPLVSSDLLYIPRRLGEGGFKSKRIWNHKDISRDYIVCKCRSNYGFGLAVWSESGTVWAMVLSKG